MPTEFPHESDPSSIELWRIAAERADRVETALLEAARRSLIGAVPPPSQSEWDCVRALRAEVAALRQLAMEDLRHLTSATPYGLAEKKPRTSARSEPWSSGKAPTGDTSPGSSS